MSEIITFDSICNKLGFDFSTYSTPEPEFEDDNYDNPFDKLSIAELDFVIDYMRKIVKA